MCKFTRVAIKCHVHQVLAVDMQFIMQKIIPCKIFDRMQFFGNDFLQRYSILNIIFFCSNESGPVERRQAILHAKIYGPLRALQSIPHGLFTKVSLNTDDIMVTKFIARHLKNMSENSFRSTYTGKLNKDLETNMEVNKLLRTRQDLTFRVQYTPNDITFPPAVYANKMAMNAANDAQNNRLRHHKCETCEEF